MVKKNTNTDIYEYNAELRKIVCKAWYKYRFMVYEFITSLDVPNVQSDLCVL